MAPVPIEDQPSAFAPAASPHAPEAGSGSVDELGVTAGFWQQLAARLRASARGPSADDDIQCALLAVWEAARATGCMTMMRACGLGRMVVARRRIDRHRKLRRELPLDVEPLEPASRPRVELRSQVGFEDLWSLLGSRGIEVLRARLEGTSVRAMAQQFQTSPAAIRRTLARLQLVGALAAKRLGRPIAQMPTAPEKFRRQS